MSNKEKQSQDLSASDYALWKVNDVARFLKMAPQSIYRAVSEKSIPFIKIGGAVRFDEQEIRKWLDLKKNKFKGVRPN